MTTGEALGVGCAVIGAGAVGLYIMKERRRALDATGGDLVSLPAAPPPGPPKQNASVLKEPVTSAVAALQTMNALGCKLIVGAKGVPSGVAAAGCDAYTNYLSPIGLTSTALHLVEKVPVIGGPIKATEKVVTGIANKVVSLPLTLVQHPAVIASTVVKVAAVPVQIAAKGAKVAAGAVVGVAKSPIFTLATAPAQLTIKSVTLPAHFAVSAAKPVVKVAAAIVKAPVKAIASAAKPVTKALSSVASAIKFW